MIYFILIIIIIIIITECFCCSWSSWRRTEPFIVSSDSNGSDNSIPMAYLTLDYQLQVSQSASNARNARLWLAPIGWHGDITLRHRRPITAVLDAGPGVHPSWPGVDAGLTGWLDNWSLFFAWRWLLSRWQLVAGEPGGETQSIWHTRTASYFTLL